MSGEGPKLLNNKPKKCLMIKNNARESLTFPVSILNSFSDLL